MPQAVAYVAAQIATYIGSALTAAGISSSIISLQAFVAATAAVIEGLIYTGLAIIGSKAVSKAGHPEQGKTNFRQSIPRRRKGYGTARIAGYYAFYEAKKGVAYDVIAFHAGPIGGFVKWYAGDDEVNVDGSGFISMLDPSDNRYGNNKVKLEWRLGAVPETAYADVVADWPGVWTTNHRGDGIASFYQRTQASKESTQAAVFPQGVPMITPVCDLTPVWDWRTDPEDPEVKATSKNVILNFADWLCAPLDEGGYGQDFARRIEPSLAYWTAAADRCDAEIEKIGGVEATYEMGGFYDFDAHPADLILEFMKCCDGFMTEAGDGSLVVFAGEYYEPTITFSDPHIINYTWKRGRTDEEATNELNIQFTSPDLKYTLEDADPWRNEADIAARGGERTDTLDLRWVQRKTQARRLGKREMARRSAALRGSITTNLYGLRGLGERYLRIQISEVADLNDVVVEVEKLTFDLASMTLTFQWVLADPNIDDWDAATEENNSDPLDTPDRPPVDTGGVPVIETTEVFYQLLGLSGAYAARLKITVEKPDRNDLRYVIQWRRQGGTAWTPDPVQDAVNVDSDSEYIVSQAVALDSIVEFQVAFAFPDGSIGEWTATETKDTTGGVGGNPTPGDPGGGGDPTDPGFPGDIP